MGSYVSHSADVESAYPGSEERPNLYRFYDPRSPSMEINRTPIMVTEPINRVLDPRSPSEGIERTPITYQLPQKFRKPCIAEVPDKIPPLRFDDTEDSKTEEINESILSFIAETLNSNENKNDSPSETVKIVPNEKEEKTMEEKLQVEVMPSPILPLVPNEHIITTPGAEILTSVTTDTTTTTTTSTKLTDSLVSKSKIPTGPVTKKASTLPSMMPLANSKKKSDLQVGKGFGWKKSGGGSMFSGKTDSEGRSPLLNRNRDDLAFSPLQPKALSKIQQSYRQNPLRSRSKDAENVLVTDMHNKENVTILWEN